MTLINKINCYKKTEATLQNAVNRAINECIEENVLADFLRKHRGDVMGNCLTEFNEEAYKKGLLEEGRELACIENAKKFFQNGVSYELVRASIEHLKDDQLQKIYDEVITSK